MDEERDLDEPVWAEAGATVQRILQQALRCGASHVHLNPVPRELHILFRVDGFLTAGEILPGPFLNALVGRIKVIAGLDLTERRRPQTGGFVWSENPKPRIRVEVAPTLYGERVTLAIQHGGTEEILALDALDLREQLRETAKRLVRQSRGLILAAGPAESGKTTLLYALLREAGTEARHAASIECPIERPMEGVSQMEANPHAGSDMHGLLASVKRQDVDVLLCSRLEDGEAVRQVIHLAAERCLVVAGMHTLDAAGTITRLLEMGAEPFLIGDTLLGVIGMRLARRICANCRVPYEPASCELESMGLDRSALHDGRLWRGQGCEACRGTGYRGRMGLHEVLLPYAELRNAICRGAEKPELIRAASDAGFASLRQDGIAKVREGFTTWAEVLRVL